MSNYFLSGITGVSIYFTTVDGDIPARTQHLEMITRPGVNGMGYRRNGARAESARIRTLVDFTSRTLAEAEYALYATFVGVPVLLVRTGFTNRSVFVESIESYSIRRVLCAVGGLNTNSTHLLEANWVVRNP